MSTTSRSRFPRSSVRSICSTTTTRSRRFVRDCVCCIEQPASPLLRSSIWTWKSIVIWGSPSRRFVARWKNPSSRDFERVSSYRHICRTRIDTNVNSLPGQSIAWQEAVRRSRCESSRAPISRWSESMHRYTDGTRRPSTTRRMSMPITNGWSSGRSTPRMRMPCIAESPATICSTSPGPCCCGAKTKLSPSRRSKCWREWPTRKLAP